MSKCTACLQGMCRKHPTQDHGEREKRIKAMAKSSSSSFLKRSYEELIKGQLDKIEADSNIGSKEERLSYKTSMEEEREKASKKERRKFASEEHEELSRKSGLNPAVLATMLAGSDSEPDEDEKEKSQKNSQEEEGHSQSERRRKKSKKEKKEKKSSSKKDKKSRKKEKRKSATHSSSSSDSETEERAPLNTTPKVSETKVHLPPACGGSASYYGLV